MGLDMFACTTRAEIPAVDFEEPQDSTELFYWRKHPNLQGWMEALYLRKGGRNPEFNLSALVLDSADLDQLESDVTSDRLPDTSGFFFGHSDGSERDDDLAFIDKARAALASGKTVFYVASW